MCFQTAHFFWVMKPEVSAITKIDITNTQRLDHVKGLTFQKLDNIFSPFEAEDCIYNLPKACLIEAIFY